MTKEEKAVREYFKTLIPKIDLSVDDYLTAGNLLADGAIGIGYLKYLVATYKQKKAKEDNYKKIHRIF